MNAYTLSQQPSGTPEQAPQVSPPIPPEPQLPEITPVNEVPPADLNPGQTEPTSQTTPPVPHPGVFAGVYTAPVPPTTHPPFLDNEMPTPTHGKRAGIGVRIVGIVFALLLVLLSGTGALAYFIAAEKITMPNKLVKEAATRMVTTIPFLPKTSKMILNRTFLAHQTVKQSSFEVSMAATSDDFASLVGANRIDAKVTGYTDITDTKNVKFSLNGWVTKEFNFEVRKSDKNVYFKLNKLPSLLLTAMGIEAKKLEPVLKNWVVYDTTPLETDANKKLDELRETKKSPTDEAVQRMADSLLNEKVLPHIVQKQEKLDDLPTYKLTFKPTAEVLDGLAETLQKEMGNEYKNVLGLKTTDYAIETKEPKLSDVMKDFEATVWIDQTNYYMRKMEISFTLKSDSMGSMGSMGYGVLPMTSTPEAPVIMVLSSTYSDFGKTLPIELPPKAISVEEFFSLAQEAVGMGRQMGQARDSQRQADLYAIANALAQYAIENNGENPKALQVLQPGGAGACIGTGTGCVDLGSALVPKYLAQLPQDPERGTAVDTGYSIKIESNGRKTLTASGSDGPLTVTR